MRVLSSHGRMPLNGLVEALGMAEHTKTLFHLKALKLAGFIGQDDEKAYFIVKKGERALECLKSLEYFLKDI